jgi:hypothetical protein
MQVIAEVKRQGTESAAALIRRFTKRVQGTGALMKVRRERYHQRIESKLKEKRRALDGLTKRKHYERLRKLGKATEKSKEGPRR